MEYRKTNYNIYKIFSCQFERFKINYKHKFTLFFIIKSKKMRNESMFDFYGNKDEVDEGDTEEIAQECEINESE
ncbi:MAG: hypothetical protein KAJ19_14995 [Gammaproteobacteria bacterium]|nr:hypothetical protein [Gammaproteobacteria bacterium]